MKNPNIGDTKEVVKFAIFPQRVEGKTIWLKKYIGIYRWGWCYRKEYVTNGILLQNTYEYSSSCYDWDLIAKKTFKPDCPHLFVANDVLDLTKDPRCVKCGTLLSECETKK